MGGKCIGLDMVRELHSLNISHYTMHHGLGLGSHIVTMKGLGGSMV